MTVRDKILYMSFGAGLVVLGMVLNSLVSGDANAQVGVKDTEFGYITCKGLIIKTEDKQRGYFGLDTDGNAVLEIYGDDGKSQVAYLGQIEGEEDESDVTMFFLRSKSITDKEMVSMSITGSSGLVRLVNNVGEDVVNIGVLDDGGVVHTIDKYGNFKFDSNR